MICCMVSTSETGSSGLSAAICFCTGTENASGSVAVRNSRVNPPGLFSPLRAGKYMAALLGCDAKTIRHGQRDLFNLPDVPPERCRKKGVDANG